MMSNKVSFLLFGDQSSDTQSFLSNFYRYANPGTLAKYFLEEVASALRHEIDRSSSFIRQQVPHFTSIQDLNQNYLRCKSRSSAVDFALLSITQLVHYIDHVEKNPEDIDSSSEISTIGVSTGLFAAAVVSSATSPSALIPIAVEAVLISFRVGAHVAHVAENLQHENHRLASWAHELPGVDEAQLRASVDAFNRSSCLSETNKAYISAIRPTSFVVSGPPSTLEEASSTGQFAAGSAPLPVHGPCHAVHIHKNFDVEMFFGSSESNSSQILERAVLRFPLLSSSGGQSYTGKDARSVLQAVICDILIRSVDVPRLVQECVSRVQEKGALHCSVSAFGSTDAGDMLAEIISTRTHQQVKFKKALFPMHVNSYIPGDHGSSIPCKLAIVGMAGRFPDAASHEKLWELLEKGLDVHREVPKDRFDAKTHVDVSGKGQNKSHTPYGCWIEDPGLFDPRFFNMSPREALQTDPMQRLALSTCYEALEMSGYVPNRTRSTRLDRIGTFYGQTSDDWREINAAQDVDTYFITGGVRAFGPGRINYHFGFSGPSFSIDTACSSSMAATQLACTSLWAGECDTAIVGGMSCMTNSDIFAGLSKGQFLSKNGPCATFDDEADGYCRADGVGTIVVKRLEDAIADKDNVLGVILGTATNHSAEAISITHPHGGTQEILYKKILDMAGVDPLDVDYVEMHGTGTQAGDGTEMVSVTNVFAPADRKRTSQQPLYLGAVKANVGHGEAASGITAIIKCLLMLQKNAIPPHVGIKKTINSTFPKDLSSRNVNIAFHKTPLLGKPGQPRRIFVNNFSAAGGNSGLLLEDGPASIAQNSDPRTVHLVAVSAKSRSAMLRNVKRLVSYLEENPETSLASLSYTTTARRIHHNWRMMVTGKTVQETVQGLLAESEGELTPVPQTNPRLVLLFTGQGSHYAAMGRELFSSSIVFRDTICDFENIACLHGFPSFRCMIDGSITDIETLSPIVVQLGLVCLEMALYQLLRSWGITPDLVLGHSLGEYAALYASGVLSASNTIYLVGSRAKMLVESCTPGTHSMLAVQASLPEILATMKTIQPQLDVTCINSPSETVLGGTAEAITEASKALQDMGLKCTTLRLPFAFHSSQVDPILDQFEHLASSVKFNTPKVPFVSSLLGRTVSNQGEIGPSYLRRHARETVNFRDALESLQQTEMVDDKTVWLEVGPHPICSGMVKKTISSASILGSVLRRNENVYSTLTKTLSMIHTVGVNVDWNEYHREFSSSLSLLDLPSYSFDDKNYWLQYTGDWSLTKGRVPLQLPKAEAETTALHTTTIHKIVDQSVEGGVVTIVTETDIGDPILRLAIGGHLVNGSMMCPSSIYGDMAMTVCDHAYKLLCPGKTTGLNVAHMEVNKPLIGKPEGGSQMLYLSLKLDLGRQCADLVFSSGSGPSKVEHAKCQVLLGDPASWMSDWERSAYLLQSRIDWLQAAEKDGRASKIGRGLAYKLFSALVDYDTRFRGMEEVILGPNMEATSRVLFQTTEADGKFFCSPYWIDSVSHISGFIVNGSDAFDSRKQVFVSHGWESMRFAEPLQKDKEYRSYVRMQPVTGSKMVAGDVFVFDGERVVGMVGGLKFQCIPRSLLNTFLPPVGAAMQVKKMTSPVVQKATQRSESSRNSQLTMRALQSVNKKLVSITSKAMDILAKEIGISTDELVDNIAFADLGVDSLMSLTVSGRMREELEMDVQSSIFNDYPTIGALKKFLAGFEEQISSSTDSSSVENTSPENEDESPISTPSYSPSEADKEVRDGSIIEVIRGTISEEMGIKLHEITRDIDLASLGMDSLMSLQILGCLREKTGLSLPADLFIDNPTIQDVEKALNLDKEPTVKASPIRPKPQKAPNHSPPPTMVVERLANSVLLQGNARTAAKTLFIIPDGSGSATSYTSIPPLFPSLAVFGLNSPYMKNPTEFNCGVVGIATKYITEIKRRQPSGPYLLAGWSAGGVIAFECAYQLLAAGNVVEHVVLIDTPCPLIIERLPQSLHQWFAEIGLLGDPGQSKAAARKIPDWLLPHFASSVTALSTYTAKVLPVETCPKVTAIWCEDGVCKYETDPRPDPYPEGHALWLLDNRTDFGPNLWDTYIDTNKLTCRQMAGNHFSMMKGKEAAILGDLIREALRWE